MPSAYLMLAVVTLLVAISSTGCSAQCNGTLSCFPPLGDLTLNRTFSVNSTCSEGEEYILSGPNLTCDPSLNSLLSINDDDESTYWVSKVNSNFELPFFVQLNFEAPVFFYSTEIKWSSRTPTAMRLERYTGTTWAPYRYFANNCNESYSLSDSPIIPDQPLTNQVPVCTSMELRGTPGGIITFETSSHLPNGTSEEVVDDYQMIYGLRIVVDAINEDSIFGAKSNLLSINEWSAQGTCICNGHASMCSPVEGESMYPEKVYAGCLCSHNTAGTHCEQCATGYNNKPWLAGNETNANVCEACQCNGHADDCFYNATMMSATCIDCYHNTTGADCSACLPTFYPDTTLLVMDANYCKACQCDEAGVVDEGECDVNGTCNCKSRIDPSSAKCSQCAQGYWNLSSENPDGCQSCECGNGTLTTSNDLKLCNVDNGKCSCLSNRVVGDRCDACEDGYYELSQGCQKECLCNPIGSLNLLCDPNNGQCNCKESISGVVCATVDDGYYYKTLDDITLEAEDTDSDLVMITPLKNANLFSGNGYLLIPSSGATVTFEAEVPISSNYFIVVRYKASVDVSVVLITVIGPDETELIPVYLSQSKSSEPNDDDFSDINSIPVSTSLEEGVKYTLTLSYLPSVGQTASEWMIDSIVLIPDITKNSSYFETLSIPDKNSILSCLPLLLPVTRDISCDGYTFAFSLEFYGQVFECEEPNKEGVNGSLLQCGPHGQQYECLANYSGPLCDRCANGYYNNSEFCDACPITCNAAGSLNVACNLQTGECDCRDHVKGEACDMCDSGYYNLSVNGCTACQCSEYALSAHCNETGVCECPENVSSPKCNQCVDGSYNISSSGCISCGCNPAASSSAFCDKTTGECNCTEGAIGLQCEECPDTHYRTIGTNQEYCTKCFCFNHSSRCVGDNEGYILTAVESDFGQLVCAIEPECSLGWTFNEGIEPSFLSTDEGFGYFIINGGNPTINAPEAYHQDFRLSYGHNIVLVFVLNSPPSLSDLLYIKISNPNTSLYSPYPLPTNTLNEYNFTIPLIETYWRVGSVGGPAATLGDLVDVLADLVDFRFTGKFTNNIFEFNRLKLVSFPNLAEVFESFSGEGSSSDQNTPVESANPFTVESCLCPEGHKPPFCDECLSGYYKEKDSLVEPCVKCQCNNLATSCATPTGVCMNCTNNTQGYYCEQCIHGYYGDPANNIPCVECDCNGLSPTCDMSGVCDDCAEGYRGDHCEECDNGYHNVSGTCELCGCGSNINTTVDPFCDPDTGKCLACTNNTEGFNCNVCISGYFGDIANGVACQVCECNLSRALSEICNSSTGVCLCEANTLSDCSQCKPGFYSNPLDDSCIPCPCPVTNNSHASSCFVDADNQITCVCDKQYSGRKCEECNEGYFGNPLIGICNDCSCNGNFDLALGSSCDMETGFCMNCTNHTYGAVCENCDNGYYGDPENDIPCKACTHCNLNGTMDEICDMVSGSCLCRSGVTGTGCTECFPGSFGAPGLLIDCKPCPCVNIDNPLCHLNDDGITATCDNCGPAYSGQYCELCANGYYRDEMTNECVQCNCNGNVDPQLGLTCNSTTGECLQCQSNTFGFNCEQCLPGYFGDVPNGISCTACSCSLDGVKDDICDPKNGTCLCLPNVIGSDCSHCESGYWGLSAGVGCEPCNCCVNGSVSMECNQTTGQCPCLEGVEGTHCCDCEPGYYNLTETGCTACGCGDLAMTPSCNSTGYCDCREDARGKKCDECSFGYIGKAPNCTRCHICFFLWNDIIAELEQSVPILVERIQVVLGYYGTFSVEEIRNTSAEVESTLNDTTQILKRISVDTELVTNISTTLNSISTMYNQATSDTADLLSSLELADETLSNVSVFIEALESNGISGIDVDSVFKDIESYNTTIKNLQAQATLMYNTLITNQMNLMALQTDIDSFKKELGDADGSIWQALNKSSVANQIAQMAWSVETKISIVNTTLGLAEKRAVDFQVGLIEETVSIDELVADLEMLEGTLEAFNLQLKSVSMLSEELDNSTMRIKSDADGVVRDIEFLMNATNETLASAEKMIDNIGYSRDAATEAAKNMSSAQATANNIHQIPTPSQGDAASLATSINNTIIPEQEVKDVVQDADETARVAKEHLEKAVNASSAVSNLQSLVDTIQYDHSTIENALDETGRNLDSAFDDINEIKEDLNKISENSAAASDQENVRRTVNKTKNEIKSGRDLLTKLQTDVEKSQVDSQHISSSVATEGNKIEAEVSSVNEIKQNTTAKVNMTQEHIKRANAVREKAQESKKNATQIAVDKLSELLANYKTKLTEVSKAKEKIKELETELESLAESFDEASKKYKECYKTP